MLPLSCVTGMINHLCPKISSTRPKRCTLLARFSLMLTSEPVTMPTDLECTDWLSVGYAVHLWLQPGPLWLLCKLTDSRSMSYWKWGVSTQEAANKWSLIWVATSCGPIMLFTLFYSNVVSFLSHFFFPVPSFLRFPTLQPLTSQRRERWERVLLTIFPSTTNTPVLTHQRMRLFLMPYMDNMFSVYLFPLPTSHFWKLVCQQSISFRYLQSILFPTLGFLSSYKDT